MGFETSPFGGLSNVTTDVNNHYGPRSSDGVVGVSKTEGYSNELVISFTGTDVGNAAYPLLAPSLPAGAVIEDVILKVTEAFALGGTSPTIEIGTESSEATNGFTITEAQAEATGTYDLTSALSGTWAAPLAAATTVGLAQAGTSPTVTSAGVAKAIIRYSFA